MSRAPVLTPTSLLVTALFILVGCGVTPTCRPTKPTLQPKPIPVAQGLPDYPEPPPKSDEPKLQKFKMPQPEIDNVCKKMDLTVSTWYGLHIKKPRNLIITAVFLPDDAILFYSEDVNWETDQFQWAMANIVIRFREQDDI